MIAVMNIDNLYCWSSVKLEGKNWLICHKPSAFAFALNTTRLR